MMRRFLGIALGLGLGRGPRPGPRRGRGPGLCLWLGWASPVRQLGLGRGPGPGREPNVRPRLVPAAQVGHAYETIMKQL